MALSVVLTAHFPAPAHRSIMIDVEPRVLGGSTTQVCEDGG